MKLNNHGWGLQELLIGIFVLGFCLLLVVSLINQNFQQLKNTTSNKSEPVIENYSSYKEIEKEMIKASKKYQEAIYGKDLQENDHITVTIKSLVRDQYLKEVHDIKNNSIICSGYVTFIKNGEEVDYKPYLKCGEKYQTKGYLERLDA